MTIAADWRFGIEAMLEHPLRAIALRDSNEVSLSQSASGGAFAVLARAVLIRGGVVFGASLFDDGTVRHIPVSSLNELCSLQGSKYVRSDVGKTYAECAELLEAGNEVLYSGTPCQIFGLRAFLAKRGLSVEHANKLICVDLICHGTPAQKIFRAYLNWLAQKERADGPIYGYQFRSKLMGWGPLCYYYYFYRRGKKRERVGKSSDDPYYSAFVNGFIYQKGCYSCPFARIERVADFTIGDYWGLESAHPEFYDNRGVSSVLINTERADKFFSERCANTCIWIESNVESVKAGNSNLVVPARRNEEQENLAREVEGAINAGDYERAFGVLLSPHLSVAAKVRLALPWRVSRALIKAKR